MLILVVSLSMLAISSAVSVWIGGWIFLELQSKAVKRIQNFAHQVSDWEAAALQEGLCFVGVMSLFPESDVMTKWFSSIDATTTDDVVWLFAFWDCRAMRAAMIVSVVFQSSSLFVRPWFGMVA